MPDLPPSTFDAAGWPLVTADDDGIRPAGRSDQCFYCHQFVGSPHKQDCVTVQRMITVRYVFEFQVAIPHDWTKENFEFHRNEGIWCADNALRELEELAKVERCLCASFTAEFVRDGDRTPIRSERNSRHVKGAK